MKKLAKKILKPIRDQLKLPKQARDVKRQDAAGLPSQDPGVDKVIDAGIQWLCVAQDNSSSSDGGIARDYSLINGWASSYPETSGYIIPTLLDYADKHKNQDITQRAKRVLDWLVSIQFPEGGFQGGIIGQTPIVPVTFNTGQILIGLAAGAKRWDEYLDPMNKAATWLAESLDEDGCWRKHPTPFAAEGEKAYETHVSWGLLEAARVAPRKGYDKAAQTNIDWAIGRQQGNGWVDSCCLETPDAPLTHTLGYFLRGVIEGYLFNKDLHYLKAAQLTADGLLGCIDDQGYLSGRLGRNWEPAVKWVCLTGSVQIAHCWLILWKLTKEDKYRVAGCKVNEFVRRSITIGENKYISGAVKGSFPVDGEYGRYQYLNWATKFFIDSNMCEQECM